MHHTFHSKCPQIFQQANLLPRSLHQKLSFHLPSCSVEKNHPISHFLWYKLISSLSPLPSCQTFPTSSPVCPSILLTTMWMQHWSLVASLRIDKTRRIIYKQGMKTQKHYGSHRSQKKLVTKVSLLTSSSLEYLLPRDSCKSLIINVCEKERRNSLFQHHRFPFLSSDIPVNISEHHPSCPSVHLKRHGSFECWQNSSK